MVYITGDTHARFERVFDFCMHNETTINDVLIILGDAGINYHLNSLDIKLKKELAKCPITLFCIHGNHEERPYNIQTYDEKIWHKGSVYYEPEYPNIVFAKDGEVYDFDGKKAFAIGGAYSIDKYYRLRNGYSWFASEQPNEDIKTSVEQNLNKLKWKIDFLLSHTCPIKYEPIEVFLPNINQTTVDKSVEEWLGYIENKLEYEKWFCGHFHTNKKIDNMVFLYEKIEKLF